MSASTRRWMRQLVFRERTRYLLATSALILATITSFSIPLVSQVAIDGVLTDGAQTPALTDWIVGWGGGAEYLRTHFYWFFVAIALLALTSGMFTYFRGQFAAAASERIARRLRDELYDQLERAHVRYLDDAETGDLVQRATSDVDTFRLFLRTQIVEIGRAVVMLSVPIPLMFALSPKMTLVAISFIPVIFAFSFFYFRRVKEQFLRVDESEGRLTSNVQENLTAVRVVRAFARQEHECEKFGARNREYRDLNAELYNQLANFWSISDFFCIAQLAVILTLGGVWVSRGELAPGTFFYFLAGVNMYLWPVRMSGRIFADLGKAQVAIGRISEVLNQEREDRDDQEAIAVEGRTPRGEPEPLLRLERVGFAYQPSHPVITDVSFDLGSRETLAIIGPSGSGKTSIAQLLLRFYEPTSGRILFAGRPLRDWDRRELRAQLAVVLQEPFLFSKQIRENVRFGRPNASEGEIVAATEAAAIHASIESFDEGYETVVGERGLTLSGGQRQRVAIARALIAEPKLLLLDDSLSAVDNETESKILEVLERRRERHATILISHRLSTLKFADRILVLDRGRVAEYGTHAELVEGGGLYQRLWAIQDDVEAVLRQDLQRETQPRRDSQSRQRSERSTP